MRMVFVFPVEILVFQNVLHSHSHFAVLGWVYNALFLAILYAYLPEKVNSKKYSILFWLTQVSIIGMLFTFAWQGYAAFSIAFSTMHILLSYAFIFFAVMDLRSVKTETLSLKFIYGGLFFLFLSSLGPWGLVAVVMNGMAGTDLYKQVIYFYLHFQYNGWFIFSLIGLWLWYFERLGAKFNSKTSDSAFSLLFYSNVAGYTLSLLGFKIPSWIWLIAFSSAAVQLFGARSLYKLLFANEVKVFLNGHVWVQRLFRLSFLCLFIKYIMQMLSALPELGTPAFISREVTIGFIHLVMLGFVTLGLLGWFTGNELISLKSLVSRIGISVLVAGFMLSEIILFYPALVIWFGVSGIPYFTYYLFYLAGLMLLGTVMIFSANIRTTK
jgi:hypothetical protein